MSHSRSPAALVMATTVSTLSVGLDSEKPTLAKNRAKVGHRLVKVAGWLIGLTAASLGNNKEGVSAQLKPCPFKTARHQIKTPLLRRGASEEFVLATGCFRW